VPAIPVTRGRPILVIDEDDFGRETLGRILQGEGYDVLEAASGIDGVRQMHGVPLPGLVILDLFLPHAGGWRVVEAQRRDPRLAGIPLIVVSGAAPAAALPDAVVALFEKPVVMRELLAAVRRHLPC
jgi:CheY-like chemotaxis protein